MIKNKALHFGLTLSILSGSVMAFGFGDFAKNLQKQAEQMQQQMGQQMQQPPGQQSGNGGQKSIFEITAEVDKETRLGPVGKLSKGFEAMSATFGAFPQKISSDDPRSIYVGQILRTLALAGRMPYTYQGWVPVLVEGEPNAFASPGGIVQVQSQIFEAVETEDELAAVLAHEMAHVELDATIYDFKAKISARGFDQITQGSDNPNAMGVAQASYNVETARGFSTRSEFEADERAVAILHKAGYNPFALCRFLERFTGEKAVSNKGKANRWRRIQDALGKGANESGVGMKYPSDRATLCLDSVENGLKITTGDPGDSPKRTARFNKIVWNQ